MINVRGFIVLALVLMAWVVPALAHDEDPDIAKWMAGLMQPDNPRVPCCGRADAYWADVIHVFNDSEGKARVFVTITDDREDASLGRHHVPIGTQIEIPTEKLKYDAGNPTGHAVVFLDINDVALCFVQNGGY